MKTFLIILIIAAVIFAFVYLSFGQNTTKAAIFAAAAAALAFAGSYIVELAEKPIPPQEDNDVEELPIDFDERSAADEEESDGSKQTGEPTAVEEPDIVDEPMPVSDSALHIAPIDTVSWEVDRIASSVTENADAHIEKYPGSLTTEDQVDPYSFTPSITGRYRFEIADLTNGTNNKVNLVIENSGGGIVDSTKYGLGNGEGLTVKGMEAGEAVQVQVKQYTGLDSYTLCIGNQKETLDITGYTVVKDSIEFTDQRNVYSFTPPITGRYRFEISDLTKGSDHKVNMLVFNAGGGEEASTKYGIGNGEGLTILTMQAGQTYEVQVCQYMGYDAYHLNIGYQKEAVDITDYNVIADSVQYCEQKNIYYFTPAITGRYRFEIADLTKGSDNKVNLYVWNSRDGEEGSTRYGIGNGEGLTIKDMQAGETYEIQVRQYLGYDMYSLHVGKQKETMDISACSSVTDSIQYTDQRNVYKFKPSSPGKYRFEIQGLTDGSSNKVNVLVFNSRGGEEGSTSYGIANEGGLEIEDLQAGEEYEVQVRYYSGYDSYKLVVKKAA